MRTKRAKSSVAVLALSCGAAALAGCAEYCSIDVTRESLVSEVRPGDALKIKTYANKKLRMLVTSVEGAQIKGRENGDPRHPVWVGFGAIRALERECADGPLTRDSQPDRR